MTELMKVEGGTISVPRGGDLNLALKPRNMEEAMKLAEFLSKGELVPKDMRNKPADVFLAISHCGDLDVGIAFGLKNMYVVNGRLSIFGDLVKALLLRSNLAVDFEELGADETEAKGYGQCRSRRKGTDKIVETRYTIEQAKKAHLWGKAGPWTEHPGRQLQMRARGWHARDLYADVLAGLDIAEEARDIIDIPSTIDPPPPPLRASHAAAAPAPAADDGKAQAAVEYVTFKPVKAAKSKLGTPEREVVILTDADNKKYLVGVSGTPEEAEAQKELAKKIVEAGGELTAGLKPFNDKYTEIVALSQPANA